MSDSSSSSPSSVRTLVVVDEMILRAAIERRLMQEGHTAASVGSVREAIDLLQTELFDVVLCDLHMSAGDGAELLMWLGSSRFWCSGRFRASVRPNPKPAVLCMRPRKRKFPTSRVECNIVRFS